MRLLRNSSSVILCFFFFFFLFFSLLSFDVLRAEDDIDTKEDGEDVKQEADENEEKNPEQEGEIEEENEEKRQEEGDEDEKDTEDQEEKGEDGGDDDADIKDGGGEKDDGKEEEGKDNDDMETVQPESEGHQDPTTEEEDEKEKEKKEKEKEENEGNEENEKEEKKKEEKEEGEQEEKGEKEETVLETSQSSKNEDDKSEQPEDEPDKEGAWSYRGSNGPGNWSKIFGDCQNGGDRLQSPINIDSEETKFTAADDDQSLADAIELTVNDHTTNTTIAHEDHTVKLSFDKIIRINGLSKTFQVKEAHFRWGETESTGSEHSIDGKRYPLEMQIFAFDEDDFASFEDAIEEDSGGSVSSSSRFIVLATLFELSTADNPSLTEITKTLDSIQNPGESFVVDSFELKDLLPEKTDYYFRYSGSLTFPPCVERGEWIVFHERQTVSLAQLEEFRQLYEERSSDDDEDDEDDGDEDETKATRIAFNYRPVQPLNGRTVTRTFPVVGAAMPPVGKEPVGKEEQEVVANPPVSAIGNGNRAAAALKIQASVSLAFPLLALWKVIR